MQIHSFALATLVLAPSLAHAQMEISVATFGRHTTTPIDLALSPIGSPECDAAMPITISGLETRASARVIDVWWTEGDAACADVATRQAGLCTPVAIDTSTITTADGSVTIAASAHTLFADLAEPCSGTRASRTYFFFDATTAADLTTTFTSSTSGSLAIALDTIAPAAATIDGDAVGDTALTVVWSATPTPAGVRFYVDTNACGHDTAPQSTTLVPGGPSVATALVYGVDASPDFALGQTTFDTSALGWASTRYGETGAMAMTVVDASGNESPLSNLVCIYHARCTGDAGGSSDCRPQGFCAVSAIGTDRSSATWLATLVMITLVLRIRPRRRHRSAACSLDHRSHGRAHRARWSRCT